MYPGLYWTDFSYTCIVYYKTYIQPYIVATIDVQKITCLYYTARTLENTDMTLSFVYFSMEFLPIINTFLSLIHFLSYGGQVIVKNSEFCVPQRKQKLGILIILIQPLCIPL